MTTTVRVFPSPGDGLKVRVTVYGEGAPADGNDEYLKNGDPEKTYHVFPGGPCECVAVEEVPDTETAATEA